MSSNTITRGESFHSLLLGEGEEEDLGNKPSTEDPLAGVLDLASDSSEEEKQRPFINTSTIGIKPFVMKKKDTGVSHGQRSLSI